MAAMAGGLSVMQLQQLLRSISLQFQGRLCGLTVTEFRPRGTPWTEVWMELVEEMWTDVNMFWTNWWLLTILGQCWVILCDTAKKIGLQPWSCPSWQGPSGSQSSFNFNMFWAKSPKLRPSQVETQHCQALISSFLGPEGLDVASQAWRVDARGWVWMRVARFTQSCHVPSKMVGIGWHWLAHTWLNICGSQLWFFVGYYFLERCLKHTFIIYYIFPDLFLVGQGYVEIISLLQWSSFGCHDPRWPSSGLGPRAALVEPWRVGTGLWDGTQTGSEETGLAGGPVLLAATM